VGNTLKNFAIPKTLLSVPRFVGNWAEGTAVVVKLKGIRISSLVLAKHRK
jgi:hypothetical protein